MALDFTVLCPMIERVIDQIETAYQGTQGLILTEDDLKCVLYKKLTTLQRLRTPVPTQDDHILGTYVHAEVSWFGETFNGGRRRLAIKPDITILDPQHLSILHGYIPLLRRQRSVINPFNGAGSFFLGSDGPPPRLASKQFGFGGKAITFELKFARRGINQDMLRLIKEDYNQIGRLFRILDSRGESNAIFSYLVIFDKYQQNLNEGPFAEFFRNHESSHRHKTI